MKGVIQITAAWEILTWASSALLLHLTLASNFPSKQRCTPRRFHVRIDAPLLSSDLLQIWPFNLNPGPSP